MSPIALTAVFVLVVLLLAILAAFGHLSITWHARFPSAQRITASRRFSANAIAKAIVKSIDSAERENRQLSEIGFDWASVIGRTRYGLDGDNATAIRWLREYIDVPFGTEGYDWTVAVANAVARVSRKFWKGSMTEKLLPHPFCGQRLQRSVEFPTRRQGHYITRRRTTMESLVYSGISK
ncbi:hypothetical protein J5277_29350 [Rhizobium sp. 16-449-1b]|uniref:hypothetical protein n=1 Tax=Rhizobium sp. 16-449-1b TaxID=2819989 RepID=UPI001ADC0587|nr:hypothetical protein [Rhizobium sp. 16-449-1b]MBO9198241.1 hypothetical protein [Rhizobium sp. 16-449-1b]